MNVTVGISKRYAKAFFGAWRKTLDSERLQHVLEDVAHVTDWIDTEPQWRALWYSATFSRSEKQVLVDLLAKHGKLQTDVSRLLTFLVRRKRTEILSSLASELRALNRKYARILDVVVKSVEPLTEDEKRYIEENIRRFRGVSSMSCQIKYDIDPKILGGIVVVMGQQLVYDASIKASYGQLRRRIESLNPRDLVTV